MKPQTSKNQLFNYLAFCGLFCSAIVFLIAYAISDATLMAFCSVFASLSVISVIINHYENQTIAFHLTLITYLVTFTVASFTHIVSYSLLIIYPIILGFAGLYFKRQNIKNLYYSLVLCCAMISVSNVHLIFWMEGNIPHLISNLVIVFGLLLGFVLTIHFHSERTRVFRKQRDENEKAILEKNNALQDYIKSNLQLENFAHLAAHELKTPIKNISNFSQLLDKRLSSKLGNKEQEILDMIKEESYRMCNMMEDLLKLSQLSKKKISFKKINGNQFINSLIDENFNKSRTFIGVNNFPLELIGAESHLQILFFNLIENAIKYSSHQENPRVSIYGKRSMEYYYFEVKDNGIGIDDRYKKSVFRIFNKINPQVDSEGSGIGLSMCREIVERHQGQIWIEDNIEGGSVVKFTLKRGKVNFIEETSLIEEIGLGDVLIA